MKTASVLMVLILASVVFAGAESQESAVGIQKRVEVLSARRETLRAELERVEADLTEAEQALNGLEVEEDPASGEGLQITTIAETPITKAPNIMSERLVLVPVGGNILIVDGATRARFYEVIYKSTRGFITRHWVLKNDPAVSKALAHFDSRSQEKIQQKRQKEKAEREASLVEKFGKTDAERIIKRMVWIGMTGEQLRESWGPPEDINTTVTASSKSEQWVYKRSQYVYITNGLVTSWQQ